MFTDLIGDLERRAAVHAALGDPIRLQIAEAVALSDLSPSELGELVGAESNLLAHHLGVLEAAGLIERTMSHGDRRRRYLHLRPAALDAVRGSLRFSASNVLFVCTANSARSQLAEALWRAARPDVPAASAGTEPATTVHPQAVAAGRRRGLDLEHQRPSRLDDLASPHELVVTVCDRAHELLHRRPVRSRRTLHWSLPDPAASGHPRAFERVADELHGRVSQLAGCVAPRSSGRGEARP